MALVQGLKHIKFVDSPISSVSTPTPPVMQPVAQPTVVPSTVAPLTVAPPTVMNQSIENVIEPPGAVSLTKLRSMVSMFGVGIPRKFIYLLAIVVIAVIGYLAWKWFNRPKRQLDLSSVDEDIDLIRNMQDDNDKVEEEDLPVYKSDQSK